MAIAELTALQIAGTGPRVRPRRLLAVFVTGALAAVCWFTLAPLALGGPASYVVTDGVSMLPHFKAGGLVITHTRPSYHVGEVVAYHNAQLKVVVMHRIIAMDGNRFVFKGDNNDFRDADHPTKSQLVGEEWVYWPGVGTYLKLLRQPWAFGMVVALIASTSFRPSRESRRQRRRRHARH